MGVAHADPFLVQIGPKIAILEVLLNFFRTTGVQHKLLVLIKSHNIFNWKSEWVWSWGPNKSNVVKKQKKWHYQ